MGGAWRVSLLGTLAARTGDDPAGPLVTHFRTKKTAALLGYLALHARSPQSRDALIDRFWPDAELDAGRMSLRTALASLRKTFGESLRADTGTVELRVDTDLAAFENALRAARTVGGETQRVAMLAAAVDAYTGPLLPGIYDDWVFPERDRLAEANLAAIAALLRFHERQSDWPAALDYARRAVAADPLAEAPRADLIRLLRDIHRPQEALRQFRDYERVLGEQLGAPAPERVRALVDGITVGESSGVRASADDAPPDVRLPATLSRLFGRRDEAVALVQRFVRHASAPDDSDRLVTLLGPGGIGKTRLAVEVARRLGALRTFESVVFVPLAHARELAQGLDAIADALGIVRTRDTDLLNRIAEHLNARPPALLLLDNLEQCDDAGALAEGLMNAAPALAILATSRRRLAVDAERTTLVAPLPRADAAALFTDRARAIDPEFAIPETQRDTFDQLVELLDGFPLAIELAAAWAGTLGIDEMRDQIESSRLALPIDPRRDARHMSLTAAIDWSVQLLDAPLRDAFLRLSTFSGGFDADAASAVAKASRLTLAALRERSLLRAEPANAFGGVRFRLHEALRAFGDERLAPDVSEGLTSRHIDYFLLAAERYRDAAQGGDAAAQLVRLGADDANLRAALSRATDDTLFVRLAAALAPYWTRTGRFTEGRSRLQEAGRRLRGIDDALAGRALLGAATLAYNQNDNPETLRLLDAATKRAKEASDAALTADIELQRAHFDAFNRDDLASAHAGAERSFAAYAALDDRRGQAASLILTGVLCLNGGELERALSTLESALMLARDAGNLALIAQAQNGLGNVHDQRGARDDARRCYEESLELRERLGYRPEMIRTLIGLGNVATAQNDFDAAEAYFSRCVAGAQELGDGFVEAAALSNLSAVRAQRGDPAGALPLARASLTKKHAIAPPGSIAVSLGNIADLLVHTGRPATAARLFGAADAVRTRLGIVLGPAFLAQVENQHRLARAALGDVVFETLYAAGARMTQDDAVALALFGSPELSGGCT